MKCGQSTVTLETLYHVVILASIERSFFVPFFLFFFYVSMQNESQTWEIELNDKIRRNSMKSIQWGEEQILDSMLHLNVDEQASMMMHLPAHKTKHSIAKNRMLLQKNYIWNRNQNHWNTRLKSIFCVFFSFRIHNKNKSILTCLFKRKWWVLLFWFRFCLSPRRSLIPIFLKNHPEHFLVVRAVVFVSSFTIVWFILSCSSLSHARDAQEKWAQRN